MRLTTFLLFFIIPFASSQLQFSQIFHRHGQRLPTNYITFPTEHLDLKAIEGLERGELTTIGIQQSYNLGQNLREHYSKLIGETYHASNLIVYTGQDNRTVTSALAVLAALFPPTSSQEWNSNLRWLPIPVFSTEILDDVSFGILDHCPYFVKKALNGTEDWAIFEKYRPIAEFLSNKTGIQIYDLDRLQKVVDGVVSRSLFNGILPLPEWANSSKFIGEMKVLQDQLHGQFIPLLLPQTGAWHFDQLVGAFDDFIYKRSSHKMVLYSGHDTNMMTLGIYLNISRINETLQDMASYLAFDLDRAINGDYFVSVYLHGKLNGSRERLEIGLCGIPCDYQTFKGLRSRLSSNEFNNVCKEITSKTTMYRSIASVLLILLILLIVTLVAVIWSCMSWKKRYEQLADEEQRPLILPIHSDRQLIN